MFRILIATVLIWITLTLTSFADDYIEIPHNIIQGINHTRMTKNEQIKVKRFIRHFKRITRGMTDTQKYSTAKNLVLDSTDYKKGKFNPSDALEGYANCQGYSLLFHELLQIIGYENKVVHNTTHMWNMIKLNGKWRTVDLTVIDKLGVRFKVR